MVRTKQRFAAFAALAFAFTTSSVAQSAVPASGVVIGASGDISPSMLSSSRLTPVTLQVGFTSEAPSAAQTPELSRIELKISRNLSFDTAGLPSCPLKALYSRTTDPLRRCAASRLGEGTVISEIDLPNRDPETVEGHLLAFYSDAGGRPGILAQVTTNGAVPLTYVLPFRIAPLRRGQLAPYAAGPGPFDRGANQEVPAAFATELVVEQMRPIIGKCVAGHPHCFDDPYTFRGIYGRISSFSISLHRRFSRAGKPHSFVRAACPAPPGDSEATFPIVKANLFYSYDPDVSGPEPRSATASGSCQAVLM
ncbi:MAG TPA: hypothetical protein VHI77_07715 [Solirubrobacterales bacterium]|jgi:hypothetical protein|nr:hypothetical protein [Solirubrobacterales bacterium]